eukprot:TRINITY_DN4324_c0_g1_i1.p2 TRINITY_DN4324_c0_g1~~TRINITY_DN4324_c0_g1_i1.p2  ORF type:complete len:130 (+),score=63.27 TRINITY_DN4324_c0_g1_i1:611-1000(+)
MGYYPEDIIISEHGKDFFKMLDEEGEELDSEDEGTERPELEEFGDEDGQVDQYVMDSDEDSEQEEFERQLELEMDDGSMELNVEEDETKGKKRNSLGKRSPGSKKSKKGGRDSINIEYENEGEDVDLDY